MGEEAWAAKSVLLFTSKFSRQELAVRAGDEVAAVGGHFVGWTLPHFLRVRRTAGATTFVVMQQLLKEEAANGQSPIPPLGCPKKLSQVVKLTMRRQSSADAASSSKAQPSSGPFKALSSALVSVSRLQVAGTAATESDAEDQEDRDHLNVQECL